MKDEQKRKKNTGMWLEKNKINQEDWEIHSVQSEDSRSKRKYTVIFIWNLLADVLVAGTCIVFALFAGVETVMGKTLLILVGGILLCAVLYYLLLPQHLPCQLKIPAEGWKNKEMTGYFQIEQKGRLPLLYGKAVGVMRNLLTNEEMSFSITIGLMGKGQGVTPFIISSETMGILEISIAKIQLYGLLGTCSKIDYPELSKETMILPDTKEIHMEFRHPVYHPAEGENVLPSRKGYDTSLYQGIRPYEEGDSLKHIHWKMTGKTDEYLVKELGEPAAPVPVVFLETVLSDSSAMAIDVLLERFISFSQFLVEKGMHHFLCWKDEDTWDWRFHKVTSLYDLDASFDTLLRTRFQEGTDVSLQEALDKWEDYGWWFCFDNGEKVKIINKNTG